MTIPLLHPSTEIFLLIWLIKPGCCAWSRARQELTLSRADCQCGEPGRRLFLALSASHFPHLVPLHRAKETYTTKRKLLHPLDLLPRVSHAVTFHLFVSRDNFLSFCALCDSRDAIATLERSLSWVSYRAISDGTCSSHVLGSSTPPRTTQPECALRSRSVLTIAFGHFSSRQEGCSFRLAPHYARLLWGSMGCFILNCCWIIARCNDAACRRLSATCADIVKFCLYGSSCF